MKKRIWIIALIVICVAVAAGGTFANYTAEETARNVITSGGVDITLLEQQVVNGQLVASSEEAIPANPGATVSKCVSVRGEDADAWVRVKYDITFTDAQNAAIPLTPEELAALVSVDADTEHWTYRDGWWYYLQPLKKGETTQTLFETVSFSSAMGNAFQGSAASLAVTAQAVQTANNGSTVWDAAGWPES